MLNYVEGLMKQLLIDQPFKNKENKDNSCFFSEKKLTYEYRKILDKVAVKMIINSFENEDIIIAMMRLARIERIIIAFNIIPELKLPEIAEMLGTSVESVYTQKGTALKRLKKELEAI